jgi:hypothetical protein
LAGPLAAAGGGMLLKHDRVRLEISDEKMVVCATYREGEKLWEKT